jgi:hypothetical protein
VNVEILSQEIWTGFSAPDLTDADTDWSELEPLGLGQVDIVRDPADQATDSFVAFGEDLQPDTWIVTAVPDLHKGFPLNYMPVVELSNLAVPGRTAAIRVTPALALEIGQGGAVTGVVRVLHESGGLFGKRQIAINVDPSLSSPPVKVMVPVMRLHCPKHTGCQASEEYSVQRETEVDFTLTLIPVGGGGSISTSLRCSSEWETADGECLQYVLPAEISTEYGTLLVNGKRAKYTGILGAPVVRFVKGTQRQEKIPPAEDGCQQPAAVIQTDRRLMDPTHISAGKLSNSFNAVNTVRGILNLGLAAPGWPSFSFNYERTITTSFTRSYTLVPTAEYMAYTADPPADPSRPEHAEILWTIL